MMTFCKALVHQLPEVIDEAIWVLPFSRDSVKDLPLQD
jgi:hypothetical protein